MGEPKRGVRKQLSPVDMSVMVGKGSSEQPSRSPAQRAPQPELCPWGSLQELTGERKEG